MHKGPIVAVASSIVLCASLASASDTLPMARASFPILSEPAAPPPTTVTPEPAPPPPPPVVQPPAPRAGLDAPDAVQPRARERDLWMLSVEAATRAPIDAGFQLTLETPVGFRMFGGYGWVPSMYLGRIMSTAASVSSDPVLGALLDEGFDSGDAWRAGIGVRPFRNLGLYLDAGYARVSLRGSLDTADLTSIPGISGSYAVDSTLGLGFLELGYQGKIAERVVLGVALGVTKVMSAETRVTPGSGAASDPQLENATSQVDDGLEKYGVLPTLTLRLGVDLI